MCKLPGFENSTLALTCVFLPTYQIEAQHVSMTSLCCAWCVLALLQHLPLLHRSWRSWTCETAG